MADLLGENPDKKSDTTDLGHRLDPNWEPNSADLAFCVDWGLDPMAFLAEFRDYWCSVPGARGRKLSWSMTWRNRCREKGRKPVQKETAAKLDLLAERPKGGRTLAEIHRVYAEAWNAITNDVMRSLADDIDVAAAGLQEGDRAHFRGLVTEEVRTLCSPLAQAIAAGRERPPFPHGRIDLAALARRTESQLHSTAGYEGRKNISWWERREGKLQPPQPAMARPPAPEMVWSNPNAGPWTNPNK